MRFNSHHICRRLLLTATIMAVLPSTTFAQTSAYPNRAVTVLVPFAAGGSVDTAARLVLQKLSDRLKQSFVVENVTGAAGTIGTERAVRAKPDGYTLLFAVASPINVAPVVKPSTVRYDALKDLAPIATVATSPFVLVGSPKLAANNTAEVLALARAQPGKLNYGTDGVGTSMHLTAEIIKLAAKVDIQHVPYKSGPQVLTELSAGLLELAVMPVTLAQPFIRDGKVKAFGVTSKQRWESMGSSSMSATVGCSRRVKCGLLEMARWLSSRGSHGLHARPSIAAKTILTSALCRMAAHGAKAAASSGGSEAIRH